MRNIHQLSLIGLMTAVICILSPFALVLPFSPVPLSLSTLSIYFAVMILGGKQGTISVIIYILLGLAGMPVFSGFTGGIGKLLGPTGGYLAGYIFLALICGFFLKKWKNRTHLCFWGMLLGTMVCYTIGTLWLALQASLTLPVALMTGVVPYLPGDFVKIVLALLVGRPICKRLQKAGLVSAH